MSTLQDKLAELSPDRRALVMARADELTLRQLRQSRKGRLTAHAKTTEPPMNTELVENQMVIEPTTQAPTLPKPTFMEILADKEERFANSSIDDLHDYVDVFTLMSLWEKAKPNDAKDFLKWARVATARIVAHQEHES